MKEATVFRGREPRCSNGSTAGSTTNRKKSTVKKPAEPAWLREKLVALRIFAVLAPARPAPRPFAEQVERLFASAVALGIGGHDSDGLDQLRDALEDQAAVVEQLGRGAVTWTWSHFVGEVESIAMERTVTAETPSPGSVRVATVDEAEGRPSRTS